MKRLCNTIAFLVLTAMALPVSSAPREIELEVQGDDWFFESNACKEANDNVVEELEDACEWASDDVLLSYEITDDCDCKENSTQPKWVCTVEVTGICGPSQDESAVQP